MLFENYQSVVDYFALKNINEDLAKENAELRSELQKELFRNLTVNNNNIDIVEGRYKFISAKVINNSVNRQHNYITLDKGSSDGVKPDMGIVSREALVGIVVGVSDHYSFALSVLNKRTKVSAKLKESGYFGSLQWDGNDYQYAELKEIPYHVNVRPGDEVVTSGYSTIFPEGIKVGVVESVKKNASGDFKKIILKLTNDFKNLSYVEIIDNVRKDEQRNLENNNANEK